MLEVVDLKKSFGGREILHGLNLTFESGVYGLLGPNGAGKSTLMNIITGLLRQTSGQVLFHGVPASDRRSGFAAQLGAFFACHRVLLFSGHPGVKRNSLILL